MPQQPNKPQKKEKMPQPLSGALTRTVGGLRRRRSTLTFLSRRRTKCHHLHRLRLISNHNMSNKLRRLWHFTGLLYVLNYVTYEPYLRRALHTWE